MPKVKYLEGMGLMVGMIFGAGIFALPFSIARAGIFWGLLHFVIAFSLIIFLHFLYAQITHFTKGRHRITGYARIYLGKGAERLMFLVVLFAYYGTLLAYGVLGGIFLSNIFQRVDVKILSLLFFLIGAGLIFLPFKKIGKVNFYLTLPLFGFVIYLFSISFSSFDLSNFQIANNQHWFLPFGVWLFALSGFAILPEVRDLFAKNSLKSFKRVIWLSILITAIFYFIFIFSVVGTSGRAVTEDAISGLFSIIGYKALVAASIIGLLAVFTSFLAMACDLKNIFRYDYKLAYWLSWFLAFSPPIILFFAGLNSFVSIISVVGALGFGLTGLFIILMFRKLKKR